LCYDIVEIAQWISIIEHALGKVDLFSAFISDMESSDEAYHFVSDLFDRGGQYFSANQTQIYKRYIASPDIASLIELHDIYKEQCGSISPGDISKHPIITQTAANSLDVEVTVKWAFCIAVKKYLDSNDVPEILEEAEGLAENLLEQFTALQFFAVKVLIPYISFIVDAVDLCLNTSIDDFENAFLFYALTQPDGDSLNNNDSDCD
jgi:hypothetical protein